MSLQNRSSLIAVWISLVANIVLTGIKLVIGLLFNSQVLIADGIHNAGDVIAVATAYSAMRVSNKPADDDHPYGHGKAEVLGALMVAIILGLAAVYMGFHAIEAFFEPAPSVHIIAFGAAIVSLIAKQVLYVYTMRVGREANSKGLIATAYDHLADVYASIAAAAGIGIGLLGNMYGFPILAYGDPIAGLIVSFLVLKLAWDMGKDSYDILMEKSLPPEELHAFAEHILAVPGIKRIDRLRAREHGHYKLVDARVSVLGTLTVQEGHDIIRVMKNDIMTAYPEVDEVLVHLNPWYPEDE
ncbi:cation diffusion facilitator family transporter [Paenibacillus sp. N1-5-1-14]|uniref:cation diffusion facilitator family transporter n=1 Tax=Paenibacillus radicibacter TaxID=2972488 RepID=UPI0021598A14|nr:cation diffusion facilitator family transporter [Paenibacillus radicibacter]MCR8643059.1 cation diffusion facilitator family transporter [Paenibacillus radicibacter]